MRYVEDDEIARVDPGLRTFFNVNTPEDLRQASDLLACTEATSIK